MSNTNYIQNSISYTQNNQKLKNNLSLKKDRRSNTTIEDKIKNLIADYGQLGLTNRPKTLNLFYTYQHLFNIYQSRINELCIALTEDHADRLSWCKDHRTSQKAKTAALSFLQNPQSFKDNECYTQYWHEEETALKTNQIASITESQIIDNTVIEIEESYELFLQQQTITAGKSVILYSGNSFATETDTASNLQTQTGKPVILYSGNSFAMSYVEMHDLLTKSLNGYIPRFLGDIFINTEFLKNNFKQTIKTYKPYEQWVEFWNDGTYDKNQGQCRHIRSFSQVFMDLMSLVESEIGVIDIPEDWYLQYCYLVTPFPQETIDLIERFKRQCQDQVVLSKVKYQKYSHSTKASPFRIYNSAVNMPKVIRAQVFKGYGMLDLTAAFASIAWYELDMKNCELEGAELLNPLRKKEMRQKIMESFKGMALDKAKQTSQYLFSQAYKHSWGVMWFDNLHKEISKRVGQKLQQKQSVLWKGKKIEIKSYHQWFTYHEQQIMNLLNEKIVLQIHDAVIFNFEDSVIVNQKVEMLMDKIIYNDNIYYFNVETL